MNQNHETQAKWREAKSGKRRVQQINPERLRKAIQYLGEHPVMPARAPTTPTGALFPPISPQRTPDAGRR
jgi:hypothetical protein